MKLPLCTAFHLRGDMPSQHRIRVRQSKHIIGAWTILGCTCGWDVPPGVIPDDAIAAHIMIEKLSAELQKAQIGGLNSTNANVNEEEPCSLCGNPPSAHLGDCLEMMQERERIAYRLNQQLVSPENALSYQERIDLMWAYEYLTSTTKKEGVEEGSCRKGAIDVLARLLHPNR